MKEVTLTQVEATGIQEYVFGSNNLRQNIGASELVTKSTNHWVIEVLNDLKLRHNAAWNDEEGRMEMNDRNIDDESAQAEVIYAGGGSALILFSDPIGAKAEEFAGLISRKAILEARGLNLVVGHELVKWDVQNPEPSLARKHRDLRLKMAKRKLARLYDVPLPGLSVTASCVFTGLPATGFDDEKRPISQVVKHKLEASEEAQDGLYKILSQVSSDEFEFVNDFNLFCEKNESSYIAVVHADGNQMNRRFRDIGDAHLDPVKNRAYIKQLRLLSQEIHEKATYALRSTVDLLIDNLQKDNGSDVEKFGGVVPVHKRNPKKLLPFRPVVFGGDDATFVCEGRLGLALAVHYLQKLADGELSGAEQGKTGDRLFARAGVAVVKSHYPFSRAYELAEALCQSAKKQIEDLTPHGKGTVIDWHFSTSGVVRTLDQVRAREYVAHNGHSLLMRPLRIDLGDTPTGSKYWRSWNNFSGIVRAFQESDWSARRNKVIALREALRQGPEAVKLFRESYEQQSLPEVPGQTTMATTGWQANDCGYFDAVEALDFYVHLS